MEKDDQMSKVVDLRNQVTDDTAAPETELATELATFAAAAAENRTAFALRLTYNKGKYVYGKDKQTLPLGTHLVAIMREVTHGYIKWKFGKIAGAAVGRVVDGFKPNRDVLDERDEDRWPVNDLSGKVEDPWIKIINIPMVTTDGAQVYTFQSRSFYGRDAAYALLSQYAAQGADHPGRYPVVELGSTSIKTVKYDEVLAPTLNIIDWLDRPTLALPDSTIKTAVAEETKPEERERDFDFDDEVSF
jgi:hypothetical protein